LISDKVQADGSVMASQSLALPEELVEQARRIAARERMTLEECLAGVLRRWIDDERAWERIGTRSLGTTPEGMGRALDAVPDAPPVPGDELSN